MRYAVPVLALALAVAAPAFAETPFADVPRNHWAYDAIQKAVDTGILQGYDGKFHGQRLLNRFQMAVIVAKMLDASRAHPEVARGPEGAKTMANIESLTIEFADELAMLNVKVSTLEDTCAELKNQVAALKGGHVIPSACGPGAGACGPGFTAFASVGLVSADDATLGILPYSTARTRYPPTNPDQLFFTVPQVSVGIDREVNPGIYIHAQFDFASDVNDPMASTVGINEAYFMVDELLGDIGGKIGAFALPFTMEHNGPFRTLNYTISPSVASRFFESWRPYGVEFQRTRNVRPTDLQFKLGVASGTDYSPAGTAVYPFSLSDYPSRINSGEGDDSFGYWLYVAKHPERRGFGWNLGYFANGGKPNATVPPALAQTIDLTFFELGFEYWATKWGLMAQYVSGSVDPSSAAGDDYDMSMWYFLANFRVTDRDNLSLRYDAYTGEIPAATSDVDGNAFTLAFNHKVSENSLMQFEWLSPSDSVPTGSTDAKDDQVQLRYKLHF